MSDMRLVVVGAAGRMGRMLIRAIDQAEGCTLVAAIARHGSAGLGEDAGVLAGLPASGITLTSDCAAALASADGVLDFKTPASTTAFADLAAEAGVLHVVGHDRARDETPRPSL